MWTILLLFQIVIWLVIVLLLWHRAVAASDRNKYEWTPPLQDNVEIWLNGLKAAYPWTEILWQHEWINIKHKLVSLIALAFSVLFDQVWLSASWWASVVILLIAALFVFVTKLCIDSHSAYLNVEP